MITKQDKVSILITFTVGLVAGFYFNLTGFSFSSDEVDKKSVYNDFTIEGEEYGICEETTGCLSFQVLNDGSYNALVPSLQTGDIIKKGFISRELKTELATNLYPQTLEIQAKNRLAVKCESKDEGNDYRFIITIDGEEFVLDTCKTTIKHDTTAWKSLAKLWNYFQTLEQ